MVFKPDMSDETREAISEKVQSVAKFEAGDKVTIPHEEYHEGCHIMTVKGTTWRNDDLEYVTERDPYKDEDIHISDRIQHGYDPDMIVGDYYIRNWEYTFEENFFPCSENNLIPIEEYEYCLHLPTEGKHDFKYVMEEDCDICGCNRIIVSGFDNGVVGGHRKQCPICKDVKEEVHP